MTLVLPIILVLGAVTMFQRESGKAPAAWFLEALHESLKDSRKVLNKSAKAPRRKTREAPKR